MKKFLNEIEFASKSLIGLISSDFIELNRLNKSLEKKTAELAMKYQIFIANEFHSAANYYHAQMAQAFERKKEVDAQTQKDIEILTFKIDAKSASITALSGALLQIAKQGISTTYGKPENAPKGIEFNGIPVKEIIWEARNQANHYANPKEISVKVENIFTKLNDIRGDGVIWNPKSQVNFSFDVVKLLGWLEYENFVKHLSSIFRK